MDTAFAIEKYSDDHADYLYRGSPFSDSVSGLARLTQDEIDRYHSDGFLVVRGAFSPSEAADSREELRLMSAADDPECLSVHYEHGFSDELYKAGVDLDSVDPANDDDVARLRAGVLGVEAGRRSGYVRKFVGFTAKHPPLKALSHSTALRSALRQITGDKMKLFVSQALIKPPGGREKPWHQDHAYFDVPLDTPIVGVWIALDAATPENGCMHLWSGDLLLFDGKDVYC